MQKNKKAQLGGLYGGILTIASIGILIALMLYVYVAIGNSIDTDNISGYALNETGGFINSTYYILPQAAARENFAGASIVSVLNATNNLSITSTNYTFNGTTLNGTTRSWATILLTYTYSYTNETTASYTVGTTITNQFVTFLPWLGIILLVLAAGVVLFFVIRSFSGMGGKQKGV